MSDIQPHRGFGYKPDVPDHRDFLFSTPRIKPPKSVQPIGLANPIEDQGFFNSCTGNSSTSAIEIIRPELPPLSRMMAYYEGRERERLTQVDEGSMLRDVLKGIAKQGVCSETTWPYVDRNITTPPDAAAKAEALTLVPPNSLVYLRVRSLLGVKGALAAGYPVVFGFAVPEYFVEDEVATTGWLRLPKADDAIIGGHAVVAVGYDATVKGQEFVWVRNSWGKDWGVNGYFKMAEAWFVEKRRLVADQWVIRKGG